MPIFSFGTARPFWYTLITMENRLEHLEEFREVLSNYAISEASKDILGQTELVLLLAPTSTGRNTIIEELLKTGNYHFIVSDTTRTPRVNNGVLEQDGVIYWFRSEEDILADLQAGKFLEAELIHNQQVSGISVRELEKAHSENKVAITDVDLKGVENIVEAKPDTLAFMVLPPSFEEWQRRIMYRGSMPDKEHRRRMETAIKIFNSGLIRPYFTFVINDSLEKAIVYIDQVASSGAIDPEHQTRGKQLAEQLLKETKDFLEAG
jgi:guanylate kinase